MLRRRGSRVLVEGAVVVGLVALVACEKKDAAPPSSWEPDRSCVTSEDCAPAPTCCPGPCAGSLINRKDLGMAQRRVDATCTKEARAECPQAGSCVEHIYACVRSQCAIVTEGSPDWPDAAADAAADPAATASASASASASATAPTSSPAKPWDVSCKSDDDCVPVTSAECCPTPCTHDVVNRTDHARAVAERGAACRAAKSERGPLCRSAGACRGHAYLCVRSRCGIFFEGDKDFRQRKP